MHFTGYRLETVAFHNFTRFFYTFKKHKERMKKLILNPKKDTITLCLPPEWVGRPVVCILEIPYETTGEEMVSQVSEAAICYHADRYRKPRSLRRERREVQKRRKRNS